MAETLEMLRQTTLVLILSLYAGPLPVLGHTRLDELPKAPHRKFDRGPGLVTR